MKLPSLPHLEMAEVGPPSVVLSHGGGSSDLTSEKGEMKASKKKEVVGL